MPISTELSERLLSLSTEEREQLIELLDRSLDVEQLQGELIETLDRRAGELNSGTVSPIPGDQAFVKAREAVQRA